MVELKNKKLIILCHTSRVGEDYLTSLDFRNNGKYDRLPNYVILKDGSVVETLSPEKYSEFLEDKKLGDKITSETGQKIFYLDENPTAENIAKFLFEKICPKLFAKKDVKCVGLRLYETPNCYAHVK